MFEILTVFHFKVLIVIEKYCGLMCHPYNVLRKGKIFLSTFVGMRRGEERKAASHWPEEKALVTRVEKL